MNLFESVHDGDVEGVRHVLDTQVSVDAATPVRKTLKSTAYDCCLVVLTACASIIVAVCMKICSIMITLFQQNSPVCSCISK